MPRKKKALAVTADASFNPAEFDPAMQTVAAVQEAPPPAEQEAAHENGHAARFTPRRQEGQSHAEAVGRRPRYTGQGKLDVVVGAQLDEHQNPYFSIIRFNEKPSDQVREYLKSSGFEWRQENKEWRKPINFDTRVQDRLNAERTFEEACHMVREERGITHGYGGVA